jgi:diguanylate cyclase (GGDEF)-like protein/PAS domain S-box-containing protein
MFKGVKLNTLVNIVLLTLVGIALIVMAVIFIQLSSIKDKSLRVLVLRAPTVSASSIMNTNINSSLAALRGWMLIEDQLFITNRRLAWQTIRQNEAVMVGLSISWTNTENISRLEKISLLLNKLETEQQAIELLAHSDENVLSTKILFGTAIPIATQINERLTQLIDFSKTQTPSAQRQEILAIMADLRGSFSLALAEIRAFLLSADERFRNGFYAQWEKNETSYQLLNSFVNSLSVYEVGVLAQIEGLREVFRPVPDTMFQSRLAEDWNRANYLLRTTAGLTSQEIIMLLKEMVVNQNMLLESDSQSVSQLTSQLQNMLLISLGVLLFGALFSSKLLNANFDIFQRSLQSRNNLIDQNVMMASLDEDGMVLDVSNSLCRVLHSNKKDIIGSQSNFFHNSDFDLTKNEIIFKQLQTGKSWEGEFKREVFEGDNIWFASTIIPLTSENNEKYSIILEDISDRKLLEIVSETDKLTSLYNRRKFESVIEQEIKLSKRNKQHLTFAMVDIDFFKNYNDRYGHPAGDTALIRIAANLSGQSQRPSDFVFRLGGEEFGLLFSELDEEQSMDYLNQVRKSIEGLKIIHEDSSVSDRITISIGFKTCLDGNLYEKDVLYAEADNALYNAKIKRNSVISVRG